ncbi:MAG: hypothetical protein V1719_00800 [Patescibacteria group bacterium]
MKKITIISLILVGIIGATVVWAQSFSAGTSTNQPTSNTITNNQAVITVPPSILSSIKTITNKDANIKRVEIKDDQIIMDYQESTKILGIFPAKFNLRIITDAVKKQVNLMRPWWTIFGNTRVGQLLQNIRNNLNTTELNNASSQNTKIIQTISNVLRKSD